MDLFILHPLISIFPRITIFSRNPVADAEATAIVTLNDDRKTTAPASLSDDAELNTTFKSVFAVIKGLFNELDNPGSIIGTLTFDSVVFPYMADCGTIYPAFAALSGLLKTVNKEMTDTLVKVVDFSHGHKSGNKKPLAKILEQKSIKKIAKTFINELLTEDKRTEVGYRNNHRYVLSMKPGILFPQFPADRKNQIVDQGFTMLVTGGAGGITYEVIKKVVEKYKTNLIIFGHPS